VQQFAKRLDSINEYIGRAMAWGTLLMVLVQFIVVIMRYVFGIGSIFMQESIIYLHALVFLVGGGYTLLYNGHVRVDIFYREMSKRKKAWVDLFGVILLLIPVAVLIFVSSYPYVASSWAALESSKESSGIHAVYLLKTTILAFAVLIIIQGISIVLSSIVTLLSPDANETQDGAR
jgi:TRAP-type mannitol/chloroaromatic compound transport system permease small subunit